MRTRSRSRRGKKKEDLSCAEEGMLQVKYINSYIGSGVFALSDIEKGRLIVLYEGELITKEEGERRHAKYSTQDGSFLFFFSHKGNKLCIDATHATGMGRMINDNHKKPNCKVVVEEKDGVPALSIYSIRPIFRGQELCFDYKDSSAHWRKKNAELKDLFQEPEFMNVTPTVVVISKDGQDSSFFPLCNRFCLIGRDRNCDIIVSSKDVDDVHCQLEVYMGEVFLTYFSGVKEKQLHCGDTFQVGERHFRIGKQKTLSNDETVGHVENEKDIRFENEIANDGGCDLSMIDCHQSHDDRVTTSNDKTVTHVENEQYIRLENEVVSNGDCDLSVIVCHQSYNDKKTLSTDETMSNAENEQDIRFENEIANDKGRDISLIDCHQGHDDRETTSNDETVTHVENEQYIRLENGDSDLSVIVCHQSHDDKKTLSTDGTMSTAENEHDNRFENEIANDKGRDISLMDCHQSHDDREITSNDETVTHVENEQYMRLENGDSDLSVIVCHQSHDDKKTLSTDGTMSTAENEHDNRFENEIANDKGRDISLMDCHQSHDDREVMEI
ncbi:uncharacterized protein LOC132734810 isoform X4 [Ruditapes philippinarum]|uniref:uncharacterized protein LOC132734810 isoform X4 n=1 Tax=Ruditapes philippinarum TaxID=129788 RepID=UPI00295ADBBD|nr:uncharacterized protein LOC132734810 isoform X4 [Ruditapes philippinarum]